MIEADDDTVEAVLPARLRKAGRGWRIGLPSALVVAWATAAIVDIVVLHPGRALAPSASEHPAATAAPRPRSSVSPTVAAQVLVPVSAVAYGPGGPSTGDNPQQASLAIDSSTATAWQTNWYDTARFGNLQSGTGLLLSLGHRATITSIQIVLGTTPGADLEVLTGAGPAMADMRLQAMATDAGGTVQLSLARPERARYLLIWFTLLPPDSAGTFQASIYNVTLTGIP